MLALSLSDKFCCFGIFVFVFNRFLFSRFSFHHFFVFVLVFVNKFVIFSFSPFSLTKITLLGGRNLATCKNDWQSTRGLVYVLQTSIVPFTHFVHVPIHNTIANQHI